MSLTRPAPLAKTEQPTAQIAKAALRRLALERLEPTPENYERAYRQEAGEPPADTTEALATLIERIIRGIERSGHNWTPARRKEGIQRVLAGGRSDAKKLQQRLVAARQQLGERFGGDAGGARRCRRRGRADAAGAARRRGDGTRAASPMRRGRQRGAAPPSDAEASGAAWERVARTLGHALQQALPAHDGANQELAKRAREPGRAHRRARTRAAALADDVEALRASRRARAAASPSPVRPARQALPRADLEPDRPRRGRQLGQGPVRGDAAQDRGGPERARRARRQRHAASRARSATPRCAASARRRATRSSR